VFSGRLVEWRRERERVKEESKREREYLDPFFVFSESILVKEGHIYLSIFVLIFVWTKV